MAQDRCIRRELQSCRKLTPALAPLEPTFDIGYKAPKTWPPWRKSKKVINGIHRAMNSQSKGGNMFFRGVQTLSDQDIQLISSNANNPEYELILSDLVNSGWSGGGTVTVNSWRHSSSEYSYFGNRVNMSLTLSPLPATPTLPTTMRMETLKRNVSASLHGNLI